MQNKLYFIRYSKVIFKIGKIRCFISFIGLLAVTGVNVLLPQLLARIVDNGIEQRNGSILLKISLIYIILVILSRAIEFLLDNYYEKLRLEVSTYYKSELLRRISEARGDYLSHLETGNVLHIIDSDLANIEEFGVDILFEVITNILTALAVLFILIQSDFKLLLPVLGIQVLLFCVNYFMTRKISFSIKKVRDIVGEQSNLQEQYISNLKSIILTNTAFFFRNLISRKQEEFVKQSQNTNLLLSGQKELVIVLNELSTIISYLIGGWLIIGSSMSIGELLAFVKYVSMLLTLCMFFVNFNVNIHQVSVSLKKMYSELERIGDGVENWKDGIKLEEIQQIEFNNVSFSYEDKMVLNNLNFNIQHGGIYGIVGESGCGKSTVENLLYRLWEPDEGKILINGKDIRAYNLDSIRKRICIVCQDALLFDGSIVENIRMDNDVPEDHLIEICGAMKLLSLMDEKEDRSIGERGNNLSGGQRQRIAIARALIKNCDLFIFDEATAALDNISQNIMIENIKLFLKGKMIIIIAHRTEIVKELQDIFVIEGGTIVENGNHEALMKLRGVYYNIFSGKK